jgi:hypothetical protein
VGTNLQGKSERVLISGICIFITRQRSIGFRRFSHSDFEIEKFYRIDYLKSNVSTSGSFDTLGTTDLVDMTRQYDIQSQRLESRTQPTNFRSTRAYRVSFDLKGLILTSQEI